MIRDKEITAVELLSHIKSGQKKFYNVEVLDNGEIKNTLCDNIIFEECCMAIDFTGSSFRKSKFIGCNIKTCSFRSADLTNAEFIDNAVCSVDFYNAQIKGILFQNNYWHSFELVQKDIVRMAREEG
ncbi:pentapeptide repeat-containing protein [Paenibacillus wulumuqiensis]|uniref:pentapeptide repeat-containing protein n=1 Tax=Paenibacillus wulumuqiensis TaxID=1567107 RepID=UPI00061983DE|nr:pentapeptide repeat-containing protein [Paenibacillus wulumuqiensis]